MKTLLRFIIKAHHYSLKIINKMMRFDSQNQSSSFGKDSGMYRSHEHLENIKIN